MLSGEVLFVLEGMMLVLPKYGQGLVKRSQSADISGRRLLHKVTKGHLSYAQELSEYREDCAAGMAIPCSKRGNSVQ